MALPLLDRYSTEARVLPGLSLVLPPVLSLLTMYPPARSLTSVSVVATTGGVVVALLAQVVRAKGKAIEPHIFRRWGGAPTTRRLRHRHAEDPAAVEALHRSVSAATGQPLPTASDEEVDPQRADDLYRRAVEVLREVTRDADRFPVVLAENASYGMRRNLMGIRNAGRLMTVLGVLAGLVAMLAPFGVETVPAGATLALNGVAYAFWQWVVSEDWVQQEAELYAEALFRSCAVLEAGRTA